MVWFIARKFECETMGVMFIVPVLIGYTSPGLRRPALFDHLWRKHQIIRVGTAMHHENHAVVEDTAA